MSNGGGLWVEEELGEGWRWSHQVRRVLFTGNSRFQRVELMDTVQWGTALLLDGRMQSAEADEQLYHELMVHPALLHHPNPKTVFIMGGGECATAREVLRHRSVEKVVMVDIDKVVTDLCSQHLERNRGVFDDPRFTLIHDDARAQLESWPGTFDVIIGDLADPLDGGPCYQLYTQEFYSSVVRQKLAPGGVFVTQSGPAGTLSKTLVFTSIHRTLATVFPQVLAYAHHIPSLCDCWGFNLAFRDVQAPQVQLSPDEYDRAAKLRVEGELLYVDGPTFLGCTLLNKDIRRAMREERTIYTADCGRFVHGRGVHERLQGSGAGGAGRGPAQEAEATAVLTLKLANGHADECCGKANGNGLANGHTEVRANGVANGVH